ncbi:MAG: hypothetical protein RLZZ342_663 [Candidatus Parcubacteria bacterium]|jgi:hypothetical protein
MSIDLSPEEKILRKEACLYIEENAPELIQRYILDKKPVPLDLLTIFMAGSPGAGKTEFSKRFMPIELDKTNDALRKKLAQNSIDIDEYETMLVRIDVDEIREFLPQYQKTNLTSGLKGNAHVIQKAATKGLDILREYCFENHISFLHDGTFANFETMKKLVDKSLNANRAVQIFFIAVDPLVAWELTQAREVLEGRNIVKTNFIKQYFLALENVGRIKREFGDKVTLSVIVKSKDRGIADIQLNVADIDVYIKTQYNKGVLTIYSEEELMKLIP